jgi:hypothetical protein
MGIVPLDQPQGEGEGIDDAVMICAVCDDAFSVTGMTWLGASRPPLGEMTDEEIDAWAAEVVERMAGQLKQGKTELEN